MHPFPMSPPATHATRRSAVNRRRSALVVAILVACLTLPARDAGAGCNTNGLNCGLTSMSNERTCMATVMCTGQPIPGAPWIFVKVASMNVLDCQPSPYVAAVTPTLTIALTARATATMTAATRSCRWAWSTGSWYTAGSITINSSDGLPIELMGFAIEDDTPSAAPEEEPATTAEEESSSAPE